MSDLIQGTLSAKPINEKVARALGVHESTVRHWQKNNPELYEEKVKEARMIQEPFISIEDYNEIKGTKYVTQDILDRKIPGIINSRDNGILIPTVLDEVLKSKQRLKSIDDSCNVISFSNFKGGVGKTSTSINVAITLSFFGFKVLLVDSDIQGNTTSMFDIYRHKRSTTVDLEVKKIEELYDIENSDFKYTIVDLMTDLEKDNIEQMIRESIINLNAKTNTIGQIDIIPNSCDIENNLKYEDIAASLRNYGNPNKALDEVLSYVKNDYDFVIIDTPPSISLPLRMSVLATDYFIIALTADKMAKDGIAPFLVPIEMHKKAYKKEKGKDIVILGGVLNKYQSNSKVQKANKDLINDSLLANTTNADLGEAQLFDTIIKNVNIMNEAQYNTGSILIYQPTADTVRDYFELIIEMIDKIIIDKMSKN